MRGSTAMPDFAERHRCGVPAASSTTNISMMPSGRRHASLKVSHYPILLLKNNSPHHHDGPAHIKWSTEHPLPESCVGTSTWVITEGAESSPPSTSCDHSAASAAAEANCGSHEAGHNNHCPVDASTQGKVASNTPPLGCTPVFPRSKKSLRLSPDRSRYMHQLSMSSSGSKESVRITSSPKNRNRKQLWSLSPVAFHQSFDDRNCLESNVLSNSCGNIIDEMHIRPPYRRRAGFCSGDTSRGAFAGGYGSGTNSATGATGYSPNGSSRAPALGGRSPQSSFDSNGDVGQISLNFMRLNGSVAPFKNIMTSSQSVTKPTSLPTNTNTVAGNGNGSSTATTAVATPNLVKDISLTTVDSNGQVSTAAMQQPSCMRQTSHDIGIGRRKESWVHFQDQVGREYSDSVRISVDGDQVSRKSFSLAPGDDPEAGGGGGCGKGGGGGGEGDDAMTPLVKEREQGGRLIHRQLLFQARRITSDYALLFATFGIVLMIIENEMSAAHVYNKSSAVSHVLKSLILLSTGILLGLVIKFHVHEVQLFMNANSAEDWRIALTFRRCAQIALELIVCGICPLPLDLSFHWATVHSDGMTVTTALVPLDVLLSIPMFFRSYWICRVMLLHSRLFTDASSRSIAGLNRVTFNARFILKTLMTLCPGTMLMVFTASLWMAAAWVLRLCERHHLGDPVNSQALKHQNYLNSLWMIAITFLSVGYGDIVPVSHCGRAVAVITGILGTCTSSMVVAVIARKLELTRAEKHVHNFMIDTQLTKQLKHSAANVLRETWLIYKHRRLVDKIDPGKIRHHQRKFLMAIYGLRKVKRDQRKLAENSVSLGDVAKTTSNTYEMIHDVHSTQDGLALRMTAVEHQLSDIQREIGQLADLLRSSLRSNRSSGPDDSYASSNSEVRRRRTAAGID